MFQASPGSQPIKCILWKVPRKTALRQREFLKKKKKKPTHTHTKQQKNWIPSFVASLAVRITPQGSRLNIVHIYLNINKTLCDGLALLLKISLSHLIITKW